MFGGCSAVQLRGRAQDRQYLIEQRRRRRAIRPRDDSPRDGRPHRRQRFARAPRSSVKPRSSILGVGVRPLADVEEMLLAARRISPWHGAFGAARGHCHRFRPAAATVRKVANAAHFAGRVLGPASVVYADRRRKGCLWRSAGAMAGVGRVPRPRTRSPSRNAKGGPLRASKISGVRSCWRPEA